MSCGLLCQFSDHSITWFENDVFALNEASFREKNADIIVFSRSFCDGIHSIDSNATIVHIWLHLIHMNWEKKRSEIQFGGWPSHHSSSTHGYHEIIDIVFFFLFHFSNKSRGWFVFVKKNCLTLFVSSGICRCHSLPPMWVHYMYKHTPRSLNTRMKKKWSEKKGNNWWFILLVGTLEHWCV